jgi:hypothetical protein
MEETCNLVMNVVQIPQEEGKHTHDRPVHWDVTLLAPPDEAEEGYAQKQLMDRYTSG